jgi:hypothetical protein
MGSGYGSFIARRTVSVWPRGVVGVVMLIASIVVVRRFFFGKTLDAADLDDEQRYARCRRHRH